MFLRINLDNKASENYYFDSSIKKQFLGGEGLATYYLYHNLMPKINPLSRENKLLFFTGPLVGTSCPGSGKCGVYTKSPQTGLWAASYMGGNFGAFLRRAGYEGIILEGKSSNVVNIIISNNIRIESAKKVWGRNVSKTTDYLKKKYPGASVACIGPAGENKICCASIMTNKHRAAARCGVGAVMGSKKVKAIIVKPVKKIEYYDKKKFMKSAGNFRKLCNKSYILNKNLPEYGTPFFLSNVNKNKALPVKNFEELNDNETITPEELKKYSDKEYSCYGCTCKCDKRALINNKEYGIPEYESTGLLGSNLLNHDAGTLIMINDLCDNMGMDTIQTGNLLGLAMQAGKIRWGDKKDILLTVKKIAYNKSVLSKGLINAAEEWNADGKVVHSKGAGFPAYNPLNAYGMALNYAVGNRGASHLTGYTGLFECLSLPFSAENNKSTKGRPELLKFLEDFLIMFDCLILCKFMSAAFLGFLPQNIVKYSEKKIKINIGLLGFLTKFSSLAYPFMNLLFKDVLDMVYYSTGEKYSIKDLVIMGERVFNMQRLFNIREGLTKKDDCLSDKFGKIPLKKMLKKYYELRGWNNKGIPSKKKLNELNLEKE